MFWNYTVGPCGDWHWFLPLPNGWCALVSDMSQACAPVQRTYYIVGASCRARIASEHRRFTTFAAAKSAALDFALEQEPASE